MRHRGPIEIDRRTTMEALILILAGTAILAGLDLLALRFGVDSRDRIADDHTRSITS
jgi:hypothetical protein